MTQTYTQESRWEKKYLISKANGEPVDPNAEYLVLRLDTDPHARTAALAWANAIRGDAPKLSEDVLQLVNNYASSQLASGLATASTVDGAIDETAIDSLGERLEVIHRGNNMFSSLKKDASINRLTAELANTEGVGFWTDLQALLKRHGDSTADHAPLIGTHDDIDRSIPIERRYTDAVRAIYNMAHYLEGVETQNRDLLKALRPILSAFLLFASHNPREALGEAWADWHEGFTAYDRLSNAIADALPLIAMDNGTTPKRSGKIMSERRQPR